MFNSKDELLTSFRKLWNGETYDNKPVDTMMTSNLVIPEKDGSETVYFKNKPEPGLFRMCFTIVGIEDQLDKFEEDVGLVYYYDPSIKGLDLMLVDKGRWNHD